MNDQKKESSAMLFALSSICAASGPESRDGWMVLDGWMRQLPLPGILLVAFLRRCSTTGRENDIMERRKQKKALGPPNDSCKCTHKEKKKPKKQKAKAKSQKLKATQGWAGLGWAGLVIY